MFEKNLDFRSDTVTLPSPEMREAAMKAPLGDDCYGEDPTVSKLERLAANMLGKEAGLLVTSGTQGNEASILAHTQRGDEIILEASSHIYNSEVGGLAVMGGLMTRTIKGVLGWMTPEDLEAAIRTRYILYPRTSLVCVENTHNAAGGIPLTMEQMHKDWEVANRHGLAVHLDGARIFNAAIALGVNVKDLAKYADSVMFCLSKGLAAPVGSMLVGTEEFIGRAHKYRRMMGGGMRQAGIIAAPGIIALTRMVDRLAEDHENARILAEGLSQIEGIKVLNPVKTNMVYIDIAGLGWSGQQWIEACEKLGWKSKGSSTTIRLCTHYGIAREHIEDFLEGITKLVLKR
jgi:threonine aldolase